MDDIEQSVRYPSLLGQLHQHHAGTRVLLTGLHHVCVATHQRHREHLRRREGREGGRRGEGGGGRGGGRRSFIVTGVILETDRKDIPSARPSQEQQNGA